MFLGRSYGLANASGCLAVLDPPAEDRLRNAMGARNFEEEDEGLPSSSRGAIG
jgi:hypothetical protein